MIKIKNGDLNEYEFWYDAFIKLIIVVSGT